MPISISDLFSIADLQVINFSALEQDDPNELRKLMEESVSAGFFYLDFTGSEAAHLPSLKQRLLKVMETYFDQPFDVKQVDSKGLPTRGYVKKGTFSAVNPESPNESFEHLAIGTFDFRNDPASTLPLVYQAAGNLVQEYVATCEHVVDVMLQSYSKALKVSLGVDLRKYHDHSKSSDTILAMLSYPGQLTHQQHTDLGSLTVLFSDQWGLQVLAPTTGQWEWIEPRKDQAVINVGDALRFLSNKNLFSCLHRVIRDGRASLEGHRYSIAYLLRPADDTVFEDAAGVKTTAKGLKEIKYHAYSAPHGKQDMNVLFGGMEKVLGVKA